ncbi:S49 family peptidase [Halobaculum marinum]|uniref:S49 family peptidase n=1 Tax=Halobaculum marinum TaxID=3031996 RepID=A0ABD5WZ10_9EURY|nr:S49 family peptidase [Halobaculum sp. DT55]
MPSKPDPSSRTILLLVVVAALLTSAVLAPVAHQATSGPDGTVMVVSIGSSISGSSVDEAVAHLRDARTNDSIEAVVLSVDSPGGSAAQSERLYMAVERTAAVMPVVSSVQGMAASGGYYAVAPTDRIFTLPAAEVGSVGVIATSPPDTPSSYIKSGPDKASGRADQTRREVEELQSAFVESVLKHRDLNMSRTELEHAKTYIGIRAVENGLVDEVGTTADAVDYAANEAGLDSYDVTRRDASPSMGLLLFEETANGTVVLSESTDSPYRYYMTVGEPADEVVIYNAS